MRDPDRWLGRPSAKDLQAFLFGTQFLADYVASSIAPAQIFGVLDDPLFIDYLVNESGLTTPATDWARLVAMAHFEFAAGFTWLRDSAIKWHRDNGCTSVQPANPALCSAGTGARSNEKFWSVFAHRPAMFIGGSNSGTSLYAFLLGATAGGNWLNIECSPRLETMFSDIKLWSESLYGCSVSAFRCYTAISCLNGAGYRSSLQTDNAS